LETTRNDRELRRTVRAAASRAAVRSATGLPGAGLSPATQSGVTLLELLIVIALMAFIAGIALPMFGGPISTSELRSTARQLAAGLRLARSEALAERRETFLVLDVAGKRFKVDRDPAEHRLPSRVDLKLFTAQNDLVNESIGSIRFFPDGGSNGGRITVASGPRKFEVDVDWLTGRVAILD
jgi:general secretion pathway protein H